MTIRPPAIQTVWFGAPVTGTATPLIDNPRTSVAPLAAAPWTARARLITKSAPIALPAIDTATSATDDSEATWSGQPIVVAWSASPVTSDDTAPESLEASRASVESVRTPVSARVTLVLPNRVEVV